MIPRLVRSSRAGLSLVEAAIATTLFGVVLGSIVMATESSARSFRTGSAVTAAEGMLRRDLLEVADAFRGTGLGLVTPVVAAPLAADRVELQRVLGYQAGAQVLGPVERIRLEYAEGEVDDGLDNDGDGLVDECQLVRIENPGLANEQRYVLSSVVPESLEGEISGNAIDDNGNGLIDEGGLCLVYEDNRVSIALSTQRVGPDGILITRTLEAVVALRNTTP